MGMLHLHNDIFLTDIIQAMTGSNLVKFIHSKRSPIGTPLYTNVIKPISSHQSTRKKTLNLARLSTARDVVSRSLHML